MLFKAVWAWDCLVFLLFFVILETVKLGSYIKTKILDWKFDRYNMELGIFFFQILEFMKYIISMA